MAKPRTVIETGGSWAVTFSREDLRSIGATKGDQVAYTIDDGEGEIRLFAAEVTPRD